MEYEVKIVVQNGQRIKEYRLDEFGKDVIAFGRKPDCDIVFSNPKVSGQHGCFYKENGQWYVQDLNSTNGILRNGEKITSARLHQHDELILDTSDKPDSLKIQVKKREKKLSDALHTVSNDNGTIYGGKNTDEKVSLDYGEKSRKVEVGLGRQYDVNRIHTNDIASGESRGSVLQKDRNASRGKKKIVLAIVITLVILLSGGIGLFIWNKKNKGEGGEKVSEGKPNEETIAATTESSGDKVKSGEEIYEEASQSTVEIVAEKNEYMASIGTGFFIDDRGAVVTNYHVIDGASSATVTLSNGDMCEVKGIIGYDETRDIAILSTDAKEAKPLIFRTDTVNTGEKVYALGSSQGLTGTFTDGIVSQASREERGMVYIQHTAPITNGNSGGPLLDEYGKVVGINTWGFVDGQNLNFAIPIIEVEKLSRDHEMTLAEVYETEYGRSFGNSANNAGNYYSVTLCQNGEKSIEAAIPTDMETETRDGSVYATYQKEDCILRVSSNIKMDNANLGKDAWQYIADYMSTYLNEEYKETGMRFGDSQVMDMDINGTSWTSISTEGSGDGAFMEVQMLVYEANGAIYSVSFSGIYLDNENYIDNWVDFYDIQDGIMSSIQVK